LTNINTKSRHQEKIIVWSDPHQQIYSITQTKMVILILVNEDLMQNNLMQNEFTHAK